MATSKTHMMVALGLMVGLLLTIYALDLMLEAVYPVICEDAVNASALHGTPAYSSYSSGCVVTNDSGTTTETVQIGGFLDTAHTFVNNLLPVMGILAAFGIIHFALRKTKII